MKKSILLILSITLLIIILSACKPSITTTPTTVPTTNPTPTLTITMAPTGTIPTPMIGKYQDLTPMEAKSLIAMTPELIIIDVSPNYANGHLPDAINYYVGDGSLENAIPMLDKTKTYLVYCHSDSASMLGAQKLVDAGFEAVYRLKGNYSAWVDAGYEVEK